MVKTQRNEEWHTVLTGRCAISSFPEHDIYFWKSPNLYILLGTFFLRHYHLQRVKVMENKTNFKSTYKFSLFTQSITTNYITNSQNTLVLRLKQSMNGW